MYTRKKSACQCEHANHFADKEHFHYYGAPCTQVEPVNTHYGVFHVCPSCKTGCLKGAIIEEPADA